MNSSRFFILFILAVCFSATDLYSQDQYNLRSVNINSGDSTIKTYASNSVPKKFKKLINVPYYWYYSGKIRMNYGSYSGKLIHGKYEVFDKNYKLLKQGNFEYGLKQGEWNEWYPNGHKKEISFYKRGMMEGELLSFDERGILLSKQSFHKGILDGKSYFYSVDTTVVKEYKKGKEVIKTKTNIKKPQKQNIKPTKEDRKKVENIKKENKPILQKTGKKEEKEKVSSQEASKPKKFFSGSKNKTPDKNEKS